MDLHYTEAQQEIFFPRIQKRFTIVTKGRRVGITRGAAQSFIEKSVASKKGIRFLWGETIYSNVQRYIDLYFLPHLETLPQGYWHWSAKLMQMTIGKSVIDFRSADNPETWEGFGYNVIFLNEAGIILKNPELLNKTVLPMLMDYADSILIAAGVPKGKKIRNGDPHPFFELWERAENNEEYTRLNYPTSCNPFLSSKDIEEVSAALDEQTKLQEIDGLFVDTTDNPYLYAFETIKHVVPSYKPSLILPIWLSFDFNVEPNSCIIGQQPDHYSGVTFDEVSVKGSTEEVCNVILAKYSHWLNKGLIYVTGDATGHSRNSISGEMTNYKLIKAKLRLRDYNMKVRSKNMELKGSRVLCNSILSKGEVTLTADCKKTISDCQVATVDASGDLVKDSGLHKLDCQRYLWEAWFPDFIDKGHKYMRVKKPVMVGVEATTHKQYNGKTVTTERD